MAEMDVAEGSGRHQGTRSKKLSTRVDLTPMCDLGWLLITFFMLTTTMAKPKTMNLLLPKDVKDKKEEMKIKESTALTILLGDNHRVYYYYGTFQDPTKPPDLNVTSFANNGGIGDVIKNKKQEVMQKSGDRDSVFVIIKPDSLSTYQDMVETLDQMNIWSIGHYALVDIGKAEQNLIQSTKQAQGIQ